MPRLPHRTALFRTSLLALACSAVSVALLTGLALSPGAFVGEPVGDSRASSKADAESDDSRIERDLQGLWDRYGTRASGDPVRFWYFHGDGHGLYRYGRAGLTNTHSFDYQVTDGELRLRFRKTGSAHETGLKIVTDANGERWLAFGDDPREPGAHYRHVRAPVASWRRAADNQASEAFPPAGRMWIDYQPYATGGAGFHMYQFNPAGIDGRGVGWFHRGDFDNWSTEALHYRIDGDRIEMRFDLSGERHDSSFSLRTDGERRWMTIEEDPRDFWSPHSYEDGGKSFGGSPAFDVVLGLHD